MPMMCMANNTVDARAARLRIEYVAYASAVSKKRFALMLEIIPRNNKVTSVNKVTPIQTRKRKWLACILEL